MSWLKFKQEKVYFVCLSVLHRRLLAWVQYFFFPIISSIPVTIEHCQTEPNQIYRDKKLYPYLSTFQYFEGKFWSSKWLERNVVNGQGNL